MTKIPKPLSVGEETFAMQCQAYGYKPVRQYRFVPGRRWALDFAFPDVSPPVGIEIEGGIWVNGRHVRGSGFEADCRKYNEATRLGWKIFRYSSEMVERGDAINDLLSVIFQEEL